jgi:DNA-binding response OmpR family regulator
MRGPAGPGQRYDLASDSGCFSVGATMTVSTHHTPAGPAAKPAMYTVLVYSDRPAVRDRIMQAIGTRPVAGTQVRFVEATTYDECVKTVDKVDVSLLVLDGEAQPAGGLGIARQLRDEVTDCPPICVVIARDADRWLAAYAKVDAVLVHPLDPMTTGRTVAGMLRKAG